MAENEAVPTNEQTPVEEPHGEVDWKFEARKWEARAKENKAARDELDALKAAQMTEQERLVKRAEDAERQLAEANAQIQHSKDVAEVAAKSGVPAALLEFCADREAMELFADRYGSANPAPATHSAPSAPTSRTGGNAGGSTADAFADMLESLNF